MRARVGLDSVMKTEISWPPVRTDPHFSCLPFRNEVTKPTGVTADVLRQRKERKRLSLRCVTVKSRVRVRASVFPSGHTGRSA
jgi:hypothetical protein